MSLRMQIPFRHRLQRGVSMVELMVAMTISLIGTIIIFQVFEASEGIKRSTSSGGDAQQNGAIALYQIERDLRNSGMGFNDTALAGCNVIGYDSQRVPADFPVAPANMLMVPVRIMAGANSRTPDQLVIMYGSQTHNTSASAINATMGEHRFLAPQSLSLDIGAAIKGKKSITSMRDAVDQAAAVEKIAASPHENERPTERLDIYSMKAELKK